MLDIKDIISTAWHEHEHEHRDGSEGDSEQNDLSQNLADFTTEVLSTLDNADSISPYTHSSRPLSLVSFRCMLQDTGYPMEVYLPGRSSEEGDVDWSKLKERWIGWGVEVPGESTWVGQRNGLPDDFANLRLNGLPSASHPLTLQSKYPLPSRQKDYLGALIKVYDDSVSFRPASTHTFVGILSTAVMPSPLSADEGDESDDKRVTVPAIHVVKGPLPPRPTEELSNSSAIRAALLRHLSETLEIDDISAEYILLALLASPSVRPPALPPLGTLSLNIIAPPTNLGSTLIDLVPALVDLPLTLDTLHNTAFSPSAAGSAESSLSSGLLQLAEGTVLLIDERAMGDGGKLEEKAVKNLQALTECMAEQKVRYEYPYMDGLRMDAWIRPIVLSDGKSLVPVDVHLPIAPSSSSAGSSAAHTVPPTSTPAASTSSAPDVSAYRTYLQRYGSLAHARTLSIPDDIAALIQDDFVAHRRESQSASGGTDAEAILKRRMKLARIVAVSYPDATLSRDRWERVKQMDEEAERRMRDRQTRPGRDANGTR